MAAAIDPATLGADHSQRSPSKHERAMIDVRKLLPISRRESDAGRNDMRTVGGVFFSTGFLALAVSCSNQDKVPERVEQAPAIVATAREAIIGGCQTGTYDEPCDPDGAGPQTECEGLCRPDPAASSGHMACFSVASLGTTADGRLCGDASKCTAICVTGTCVQQTAVDGTPCRPNAVSDRCAGACVGGACESVRPADRCRYGRAGQASCAFDTCDPTNVTICRVDNLAVGVSCSSGGPAAQCDGCGACSMSGPGACLASGGAAGAGGAANGGAGGVAGSGGTGGTLSGGAAGAAGNAGTGGAAGGGAGGAAGSGGALGSGGASGTGGLVGTGGGAGSGGVLGAGGGVVGNGGALSSGGTPTAGGTTGSGGSGAGGAFGAGGATGGGGSGGAGGALGSGGAAASGGALGSGGLVGAGGVFESGGSGGASASGVGGQGNAPAGNGDAGFDANPDGSTPLPNDGSIMPGPHPDASAHGGAAGGGAAPGAGAGGSAVDAGTASNGGAGEPSGPAQGTNHRSQTYVDIEGGGCACELGHVGSRTASHFSIVLSLMAAGIVARRRQRATRES
jgi:hypothetical protein